MRLFLLTLESNFLAPSREVAGTFFKPEKDERAPTYFRIFPSLTPTLDSIVILNRGSVLVATKHDFSVMFSFVKLTLSLPRLSFTSIQPKLMETC